ncbi:MAG: aldo/keto reductase [Oscillospiraceae bacterium]|nr:aldo/keto reductase [Oscillospiraceae bacterium]
MIMTFKLSNGVTIPAVGYGSYLSTEKNGVQTIKDALDAGYRYIDTARFYRNEREIGQAVSEYGIDRRELFICSKVWPTDLGYDRTMESFEQSCSDLGTDYLDMFLIHWPRADRSDGWVKPMTEGWRAMERLYKDGRVRAIGLSNFLPHHIRPLLEAAEIRPVIDQLELHVGYMQEYTLSYLRGEDILPQAWSPLGRGRVLKDERVSALAQKYGVTNAQVLLRFLVQRGIPVIPKASSLQRMKENLDIYGFELTADEVSFLSCIPEAGWSGEHPDMM